MISDLRTLASWYGYVIRTEARETWDAMPGPWPVRVLTIAVCIAIPGFFDDLALIALVKFARSRKARRDARAKASLRGGESIACDRKQQD